MDKRETLDRFAKGKNAWNDWARDMLAQRKALEESGRWSEGGEQDGQDDDARIWRSDAEADFSEHHFEYDANFHNLIFPGRADFEGTKFSGDAWFESAEFLGDANFNRAKFSRDAEFYRAKFSGEASFSGADFLGNAQLNDAKFSGDASFYRAKFSRNAGFYRAKFSEDAWFDRTEFSEDAGFSNAEFSGLAVFLSAKFSRDAKFSGAEFSGLVGFLNAEISGDAEFSGTEFRNVVHFDNATFHASADFNAILVERAFSLHDATFDLLPDFIQAHCAEAPRLDNLHIEPGGLWVSIAARVKEIRKPAREESRSEGSTPKDGNKAEPPTLRTLRKSAPDRSARWRALKRLAVQAHDHAREQEFFKAELKARRGVEDRWLSPAWCFSWLFQLSSNFGSSIVLPFFWYAVSTAGFAYLYLTRRAEAEAEAISFAAWAGQRLASFFPFLSNEAGQPACLAGPGDQVSAAILLSVSKATLFLGASSSEKVNQLHACLYGAHVREAAAEGVLPVPYQPVIPDFVYKLELGQQFVSAVFIFLILLAIRNRFRIK